MEENSVRGRSPRREKKDGKSSSTRRSDRQRSASSSAASARSRSRSRSRERSSRKRSRSSSPRRSHRSSRRSRSRERTRSHRRDHHSSRHRDRGRSRSRDRHSSRKRSRRERSRSTDRPRDSKDRHRKHHRGDGSSRMDSSREDSSQCQNQAPSADNNQLSAGLKQLDEERAGEKATAAKSTPSQDVSMSEAMDIEEAPTSQESMTSLPPKTVSQPTPDENESSKTGSKKNDGPKEPQNAPTQASKVDVASIKMDILKALADARSTIAGIKKVEMPSVQTTTATATVAVTPAPATIEKEAVESLAPPAPSAKPTVVEAPKPQPATKEVAAADVDEFDMFSAAEHHQPASPIKSMDTTTAAVSDGALQSSYDDPEGYYNPNIGEVLKGKYRVLGTVGKGVFSTVLRCQRLDASSAADGSDIVAIKLIRSNEVMREAAQTEIKILTELAEKDPRDKKHCVRLLERFDHRNHVALVFESMQMNVREAMKKFGGKGGISIQAVRVFSKHLLIALSHLDNCGIVHADIKPDNVLLDEKQTMIKVCDFGSAFKLHQDKHDPTPYLVSRFYRAPEIVLGLAYDKAVDMWSVGCCLYEMFTGKVLFPGATNNEMLKLFMELKGKVPNKIIKKHRQAYVDQFQMEPHFTEDNKFRSHELDRVTGKPVLRLMDAIKTKFDLGNALMSAKSSTDDRKLVMELRNLLERMFTLDPAKRITPKEALAHPFVKASG